MSNNKSEARAKSYVALQAIEADLDMRAVGLEQLGTDSGSFYLRIAGEQAAKIRRYVIDNDLIPAIEVDGMKLTEIQARLQE